MSGLTVGLCSLDHLALEIEAKINPNYIKPVETIFKVTKNHHWMLVTLLLLIAVAMETLPIFLHRMVNEAEAIIISTTAILFVGEIIPQSICTGP